jgi:hypothetical protein
MSLDWPGRANSFAPSIAETADDAAYVFFDLWQTPLDARIKVRAAAFEVTRRWERGFSMD